MKKTMQAAVNRREFLAAGAAFAAAAMFNRRLLAMPGGDGVSVANLAADSERPEYHLLPARNWMNDPNGPIYFNGSYHMFFQYNPLAAVWGDMSWGHAISRDMLHWEHLPVAMTPTPGGPDAFGCFSGSAIAVGERVYAVYTATKKSSDALATIRDGSNDIQESQCLAWSGDARLIHWRKDPQPIVARPPEGMKITGFRDPSVWKQEGWYYMTVGSGVENVGGCVLLYRSKAGAAGGDLKRWEYLHVLTGGAWDGRKTSNPCDDGEMWECPELFPIDGGHVLIYSTLGKVFWESGVMDEAMRFTAKKKGELDWGGFYAPKTQLDAEGRRILWGWIQEKGRSEAQMRAAGWSGMMSLPRVLGLDADGTLRMRELPQMASLRGAALACDRRPGRSVAVLLPKANGEVICEGRKGHDFELSLSDEAGDLMEVRYIAAEHAFRAEDRVIRLRAEDPPRVHAFVDASVIEAVLGERIGYTKRFYHAAGSSGREGAAPDIRVRASGGGELRLDAWRIDPISTDRLTGEAAAGSRSRHAAGAQGQALP